MRSSLTRRIAPGLLGVFSALPVALAAEAAAAGLAPTSRTVYVTVSDNKGAPITDLTPADFVVKEGCEAGLKYGAGGKDDLFAVQVLSPQEIDPDIQGDLKVRDREDDDLAEVSSTQPLIKQYKANLNAYCLSLKDYITRRGGTYLFSSTAVGFDTLVLNYLRERGLLG